MKRNVKLSKVLKYVAPSIIASVWFFMFTITD